MLMKVKISEKKRQKLMNLLNTYDLEGLKIIKNLDNDTCLWFRDKTNKLFKHYITINKKSFGDITAEIKNIR